MDWEKIIEACAVIGFDIICFSVSYGLYRNESKCLKALKEANQLEMNNELLKKLEDHGGSIPYAVISGKVKALSSIIRSEHSPSLRGVLQEQLTNKFRVKWSPYLRTWYPVDFNINLKMASVPFSLVGNSTFFQKRISVEIQEAFAAEELVLTKVCNDFTDNQESLGEAIMRFISRERTVGIDILENLLLEDTTLMAIGKLTCENGNLIMAPPDNDLRYFLTPLTYDSLYKKISSRVSLYKKVTIILGIITVVFIGYYFKKSFSDLLRRIRHSRDLRRCREAKKLKRQSQSSGAAEVDEN